MILFFEHVEYHHVNVSTTVIFFCYEGDLRYDALLAF